MSETADTKAAEVVDGAPAEAKAAEKPITTMEVIVTMDLLSGNVNVRTNCMLVNALGLLEMAKTALQDNNKRQAAQEMLRKAAGGIIPAGKGAIENLERAGTIRKPS